MVRVARLWPRADFQRVRQCLGQKGLDGAEFAVSHALDFLDDVGPVEIGAVHPPVRRVTAEQFGLLFAPQHDVLVVEVIHGILPRLCRSPSWEGGAVFLREHRARRPAQKLVQRVRACLRHRRGRLAVDVIGHPL